MRIATAAVMKRGAWAAALVLALAWGANAQLINEVDSDQTGNDATEFVELFGTPNASLNGLVVVFFNGANDASYAAFDLDGFSLDANGFFVLGNTLVPGVDLIFADSFLQNGADAVALYTANGSNFPNGTPLTTSNLVDAMVYDTSDADDAGLLTLLNASQPQVDENGSGTGTSVAMARCPDGGGGARNTTAYGLHGPTPGAANPCTVPVDDQTWGKVKSYYRD